MKERQPSISLGVVFSAGLYQLPAGLKQHLIDDAVSRAEACKVASNDRLVAPDHRASQCARWACGSSISKTLKGEWGEQRGALGLRNTGLGEHPCGNRQQRRGEIACNDGSRVVRPTIAWNRERCEPQRIGQRGGCGTAKVVAIHCRWHMLTIQQGRGLRSGEGHQRVQ